MVNRLLQGLAGQSRKSRQIARLFTQPEMSNRRPTALRPIESETQQSVRCFARLIVALPRTP